MYIYLQAWLDKMKMIELQNIVAANDAELNDDGDTLNLKVNLIVWVYVLKSLN